MDNQLVTYRRDLHQIPELDFDLPKTLEYVQQHLDTLGCVVFSPAASSLCAYFDAGKPTTLAFRADMDALPISEQTGAPYDSTHPGNMHACGHDAHMAMLLGLCDFASQNLADLPHNVLAIFQPAEETTGGARLICESGVLQRYGVNAVFGIHMWPNYPAGQVLSRRGELMARSSEVHIDVTGKSVHVAEAAGGHDALYAAAQIVSEAYELAESLPPDQMRLLKFGLLRSGTACNVIAGHAKIEGTMRAFNDHTYDALRAGLEEIVARAAALTGCTVDLDVLAGYPPVINNPVLFDAVTEQLDVPIDLLAEPSMTGEDFSFYQREVPGVFFFLGTGHAAALHTDTFDLDEKALANGLYLLKSLLHLELPPGLELPADSLP